MSALPTFAAPLFVTTGTLPDATFGAAYSQTLQAIGGTAPYNWSVVSGTLPAGLTLSPGGQFTGTPTAIATSTFTVQVTDSSVPPATNSRSLALTVDQAGTTTSVASSANPSVVGQTVTLTATVLAASPATGTPTGSVTFMDGATTLGTMALASGRAAFASSALSAGTHSITARYGGDADFLGSASPPLSQVVNKGGATVGVASSVNPSLFGQTVGFIATVAAAPPAIGAPSGTVTFSDGATTLGTAMLAGGSAGITTSTLAAGNHSITASYGGDGNFTSAVSGALGQVVNRAATTTSLTSSANPATSGQAVTFTAMVAAVAPGSGTPTGTVTFLDGTATLGSAALAGGTASFTTSALSGGSHSITASYGGNGNFLASTSGVLNESVTYLFIGYLSPLATAGTYSSPSYSGSFKLGKAIPVKWQLKDSSGNYISSLSTARLLQAVKNVGCPGVPGTQAIVLYSPTSGATGNSTFRYDTTNNQFIFNWDTSSTAGLGTGCYTLVLQLADGSPAKATIVQLN